jgi:hypothetical protein
MNYPAAEVGVLPAVTVCSVHQSARRSYPLIRSELQTRLIGRDVLLGLIACPLLAFR